MLVLSPHESIVSDTVRKEGKVSLGRIVISENLAAGGASCVVL